jgi:riboflavin kinase/FMN adenylyltransferase
VKLVRQLEELPADLQRGAVSIGNFDGVHLGHARIMHRLTKLAAEFHGPAVAFTFDPHPVRLLRPELAPPPLTWTRRKADLLGEVGIDALVAYPTSLALLQLSPREFFERIVVEQLRAKALVEGPNFFFGKDRQGDIRQLQRFCQEYDVQLEIVSPVEFAGEVVSSSRVRSALSRGDVDAACQMLTQPYRLRGMVTHGAHRGSHLGFPTANLQAIDTLIPAGGVYAGRAYLRTAHLTAAINIGPNPTFGESITKVEVHLVEFNEAIYGEPLEVDFRARLRDVHKFSSPAELREQLARDVAAARQITMTNIPKSENPESKIKNQK